MFVIFFSPLPTDTTDKGGEGGVGGGGEGRGGDGCGSDGGDCDQGGGDESLDEFLIFN